MARSPATIAVVPATMALLPATMYRTATSDGRPVASSACPLSFGTSWGRGESEDADAGGWERGISWWWGGDGLFVEVSREPFVMLTCAMVLVFDGGALRIVFAGEHTGSMGHLAPAATFIAPRRDWKQRPVLE